MFRRIRRRSREFSKDERGDLPQTILLIGLIALPLAIFLASVAQDSGEAMNENVDDLIGRGGNIEGIRN